MRKRTCDEELIPVGPDHHHDPIRFIKANALTKLHSGRLYAILDLGYTPEAHLERIADQLIAGGADLLQLRAKGYEPDQVFRLGLRIRSKCRDAEVPLIINDFPEVAVALEADGLHIGQDDGAYESARKRIGPDVMLGRSTHSLTQAKQAMEDGFDYIGFGPLFPTPTKLGRPGIGLHDLPEVQKQVGHRIPVFCIGGIKRSNLVEVLDAGARRCVIVSDLLTAPDPAAAAREARTLIADC